MPLSFFTASSTSEYSNYINTESKSSNNVGSKIEMILSKTFCHLDWRVWKGKNRVWAEMYKAANLHFNGIAPNKSVEYFSDFTWVMKHSPSNKCQVTFSLTLKNSTKKELLYSFFDKHEYLLQQLKEINITNKGDFLLTLNQLLRCNLYGKEQNIQNISVELNVNDQKYLCKEEIFNKLPRSENPFVIVLDFDTKADIVTDTLFGIEAKDVQTLKKDLKGLPLKNIDVIYGISEPKNRSMKEKFLNLFQQPVYELKDTKQFCISLIHNPKPFTKHYHDIDIICEDRSSGSKLS